MIYISRGMFWRRWLGKMVLAERAAIEAERGCKFCGQEPVCDVCGRCSNPNCNAGCTFCRRPPQPRTCPCCGQDVH